ncbi:MAG: flavin monoamine oxidase family protein [Candidatus Cybelea sp.]|jgi:monoamine oxidase
MRQTRAAFVTGAASALAGCARIPPFGGVSASAIPPVRDGRVVIVGAGVAGLTCAYRLRQAGIACRIFEANDRIGGRTWTLRNYFAEGQIAEHGGEFISIGQVEVQRLARELGLQLVNLNRHEPGHDIYFFHGEPYTVAEAREDYSAHVRKPLHAALLATGYPTKYNQFTSAGRALDHTSVAEWIEANVPDGRRSKIGALLANACVGEYGGDPEVQSALNLIYLLGFEGPHQLNVDGTDEALHIVGGNDQLAARMAAALPDGTIELNSALVALRARSDGSATCTFASGGRTYDVVAERVCLAIPFTTLRNVELRHAGFSALKRIAIDNLDLGTNAKLHMQFKRRLWNQEHYDGSSYVEFAYQESWDVSAAQPGEYGILVGFPGGRHGVLPGAAHGPAPKRIADAYVRELDRLYPGVAKLYTGVAYLDDWKRDPWHHGAYSYYRVGQYTRFAGIEPVPEGNVFFAGEQTSYNDMGYINGAVISGERAAHEIARA